MTLKLLIKIKMMNTLEKFNIIPLDQLSKTTQVNNPNNSILPKILIGVVIIGAGLFIYHQVKKVNVQTEEK